MLLPYHDFHANVSVQIPTHFIITDLFKCILQREIQQKFFESRAKFIAESFFRVSKPEEKYLYAIQNSLREI